MRGHVEKRKGRWYVVLELAPDATTGARRRGGSPSRTGYRTRAEALDELDRARERGRRGWTGPERITVAGWLLDEWLPGVELEREPTTAALYRTLLGAYVIPRIGGERLENVTPAMLTNLYAELRSRGGRRGRPLSPKTVRNVHTTLRKALADAAAARRLDWNPAAGAKVPKIDRNPEPNAWTPEQVARFLAHIAGDRLEALYILAVVTGFRRGELLGLRRSDLELDGDGGRITVRRSRVQYGRLHLEKDPKTPRSRRTVAVDSSVAAMLRRHLATQASERLAAGAAYMDDALVFADEIGRPLKPDGVSAAFRRALEELRERDIAEGREPLPRLTLHGLRHSFATIARDAGVDFRDLSELLGHSSPAITMSVYVHSREERLDSAMRSVSAAIMPR